MTEEKSIDNRVRLNNVRLSFAHLFTPTAFAEGQQAKFQASFLLDPSNKAHASKIKEIEQKIEALAKEKFRGKIPNSLKKCLKEGNDTGETSPYEGYEDMMYISANSNKRPVIIDRNRAPLQEEDGVVYSGCYVNAIIDLWVQNNQYGKRVNAEVKAVQFYRDGEAFTGRGVDVENEFEDLDSEDESELL